MEMRSECEVCLRMLRINNSILEIFHLELLCGFSGGDARLEPTYVTWSPGHTFYFTKSVNRSDINNIVFSILGK